jgi:hypothetical protein
MADRRVDLFNLSAGDIFHAASPNGASLICLVWSVDGNQMLARRLTTQENFVFDRTTGIEAVDPQLAPAVIDSVVPLPPEIHNALLNLDRRFGAEGAKPRHQQNEQTFKLTPAEKKALLFVGPHYSSNPLPATEYQIK